MPPADTAAARKADWMMAGVARLRDPQTPDSAEVLGTHMWYWRSIAALAPERRAAALLERGGRVLVVQGGRDYLVTDADFGRWRRALGGRLGVTFRRCAGLNHMMQAGRGRMTPAGYRQRGQLPEDYLGDLAAWLRRRVGPPARG